MSKKIKILLLIFFLIIIFISSFIVTCCFLNNYNAEQLIHTVSYEIPEENIQERIENINDISDLSLNIDGYDVVGTIKINKINFEGLVYEGTSLDVLRKGVGHFTSSSIANR